MKQKKKEILKNFTYLAVSKQENGKTLKTLSNDVQR